MRQSRPNSIQVNRHSRVYRPTESKRHKLARASSRVIQATPPVSQASNMSIFKISGALWDKIHHFASFPQTGGQFRVREGIFVSRSSVAVSLQQMVLFGRHPSQGTLYKASQFLSGAPCLMCSQLLAQREFTEELPIRLAHRVKELDELPHGMNDTPSIKKVKNWYAQSFEASISQPLAYLYDSPPQRNS
jgi:hypothetical protein